MIHGSLFSGIGGFDLAAEWMGWENVFHCEWNEFGQKVLKHYWPNAETFTDITKSDFTKYANRIDILTGGFPCQPYSLAGKRKGKEDDRHLWPEMLRAIREIRPRWVVGENVFGLINWNGGLVFHEVQTQMENEGYEVWPFLLPAIGIGANNLRKRIWFIAHSNSVGRQDVQSNIRGGRNQVRNIQGNRTETERWQQEASELDSSGNSFLQFQKVYGKPPIFPMDDGLPFRLDGITVPKWIEQSCVAAGNAINPNVALQIFKAIEQYENF